MPGQLARGAPHTRASTHGGERRHQRGSAIRAVAGKARDVLNGTGRRTPMNNRNGTGSTMDNPTDKIGDKIDERIDSIKESVKGLVDRGEQRAAAIKDRAV